MGDADDDEDTPTASPALSPAHEGASPPRTPDTSQQAAASDAAAMPSLSYLPRRAPRHDLPDLATRIREAQRQARQRRVEQGLPADADDGAYVLKKAKKHEPKRGKRHGQFLGTVCDSWEELRRSGKPDKT